MDDHVVVDKRCGPNPERRAVAYPFVPSPHVTRTGGRRVDLIVVHTMEVDELEDAALRCARWFQHPRSRLSAHYCVDASTIVQCVPDEDVAWHAPGANHDGLGIELAGRAGQSRREWTDPYSSAVLERGALLTAELCRRHSIPAVWLWPSDLRAGRRGITPHAAVSQAFGRSTHYDPGAGFPAERYLRLLRAGPRAERPECRPQAPSADAETRSARLARAAAATAASHARAARTAGAARWNLWAGDGEGSAGLSDAPGAGAGRRRRSAHLERAAPRLGRSRVERPPWVEVCARALAPKAAASLDGPPGRREQLARVAAVGVPKEVGRRRAALDEQDVEVPFVGVHVAEQASKPVARVETRVVLELDPGACGHELGQSARGSFPEALDAWLRRVDLHETHAATVAKAERVPVGDEGDVPAGRG